jgi:two-component system chemotaxis response regulator CheB
MTIVRDVVVIGASAGGLEALKTLAAALPRAFPAAVLIVLHTAADSPRLLAKILARCTSLAVSYARDGDPVRPGHIYLAPPNCHLTVVAPGCLSLDGGPKVRHVRPAADRLFDSAAALYGPRVIGIVLTGGDGDGTEGMRAIMDVGGFGVVQDPKDACDPHMPMSALDGAGPHYCVPIDQMGRLLVRLVMQHE